MKTLLFRMEGPMQSWGHRSRFDNRDTGLEPTRSGVIGFLCAALGWGRDHDLSAFDALRMGVRVDKPGRVEMDFHTAQKVAKAGGGIADTVVSRRFFLADASFTIGLEANGDEAEVFLISLEAALRSPRWPLFLGRRSFPIANVPCAQTALFDDLSVQEALSHRGITGYGFNAKDTRVIWLESDSPDGIVRNDVPISFQSNDRRYRLRAVERTVVPSIDQEEDDDVSVTTAI